MEYQHERIVICLNVCVCACDDELSDPNQSTFGHILPRLSSIPIYLSCSLSSSDGVSFAIFVEYILSRRLDCRNLIRIIAFINQKPSKWNIDVIHTFCYLSLKLYQNFFGITNFGWCWHLNPHQILEKMWIFEMRSIDNVCNIQFLRCETRNMFSSRTFSVRFKRCRSVHSHSIAMYVINKHHHRHKTQQSCHIEFDLHKSFSSNGLAHCKSN